MLDRDKNIAKMIRMRISQIDPQAEVVLYGSRARGDAKKASDWDILILTGYPTDLKKEGVFRDHLYDLELETGESFSVFAYSKSEWHGRQSITSFYKNVVQEGISI
ncbi:MAG: nucleotidyltransferase domain-containing protein [Bacteroidota bacterium]|nr:nucleotidyltransferase domain-containing protein [Bacteroidota bacterium]